MPRRSIVKPGGPRRWTGPAIVIFVTAVLFSSACGADHSGSDSASNGDVGHDGGNVTSSPTPKASYGPTGDPGNWKIAFDDEFSGTTLDTTKWSTGWLASGITTPVNSTERECYDPDQVTVSGGALNLALITKSESCGIADPVYASGMVNTNGKFSYTYGFLQARVWVPAATGEPGTIADWPAVWTDGQNWPTDGEDDIFEGINGRACAHFHSPVSPDGIGAEHGTAEVPAISGCVPETLTGGWHTFGADWEPGSVTYYYDGKDIGSVTSGVTSAPMFVILDYASGPPYQAPDTMKVDYVRVWKKTSN
jgi:beta-glucanase (GH16 family)